MDEVLERIRSTAVLNEIPEGYEGPVLCTHSGHFHCDESLACAMMKILPEFKDAIIVRTRNNDIFPKATAVVDVGGEYDASRMRYDHHQRTFAETFPLPASLERKGALPVKMSSAGLVYLHHGKQVIGEMLGVAAEPATASSGGGEGKTEAASGDSSAFSYSSADVDIIFDKIYGGLIREVDAIDNGVDLLHLGPRAAEEAAAGAGKGGEGEGEGEAGLAGTTHLVYGVTSGLAARVGRFNPGWQEEGGSDLENRRFAQGMQVALAELYEQVRGLAVEWLPARAIVEAAYRSKETDCPGCGGQVLRMARRAPWKSHLFDIEEEDRAARASKTGDASVESQEVPKILYALYPDTSGGWRIQCVPEARTGFASRKLLPASWRGQRDEDLAKLIGIEGAVFCHAGGFIGGNKTFEGALKMAQAAVNDN